MPLSGFILRNQEERIITGVEEGLSVFLAVASGFPYPMPNAYVWPDG